MKKIIVLLSLAAFVFAMASCGGPAADGKKFAKMMCEYEEIMKKMEGADEAELEKLMKQMEDLEKKAEAFMEELEKKYDEDDEDAEKKFMEAWENYEC